MLHLCAQGALDMQCATFGHAVCVNKTVAKLTKQTMYEKYGDRRDMLYAHVELSFPVDRAGRVFDNGNTMAFSITQTTLVFMRLKLWREEYHTVPVNLDMHTYVVLLDEYVRLAALNIHFDFFGMYGSNFPALTPVLQTRTRDTHGTFCSKIIVEVLQEHHVVTRQLCALDPSTCNPNTLYVALHC